MKNKENFISNVISLSDKLEKQTRVNTIIEIENFIFQKAYRLGKLLYSHEAKYLYYSLLGEKFIRLDTLRNRLITKMHTYIKLAEEINEMK